MPARLFISYRRSHKAAVLAAKAALEAAGLDVWLDLEDIDPLADFPGRIRQGIAESHAALIWWSADYAESDICLQELRLAWQHARRHSSDVARRVWVLNPEAGGGHIFAGELNASNFLAPPPPGGEAVWAEDLRQRLDALLPEGPLADERHAELVPPIHGAPVPSREFTGRGAELMRIHSALFPPRIGAAAAGVAVQTHGLGGIGKTELAAKYVADFAPAYPAGVLWLNLAPWQPARPATEADAQAAWLRALDAALAHAPELWRSLALDPEGKARPAPEVRERLARHFSLSPRERAGVREGAPSPTSGLSCEPSPCLVVLDNLPELSPTDVRARILAFLAAPGPQGKTLVTTRDARPVEGNAALGLEVLGPDDALRLLARYRPAQATTEREAMAALVAEVGGHTQALVLLGERYREDPGGYPRALATLREQGQLPRIEAIAAQLAHELGAKARGIVATFAISIEPLAEPARHLLALASVCAPNTPIPDGLLALAFGGEAGEDEFALALRALLRASLLERRGEEGHLRLHPLVAQATAELLDLDVPAMDEAVAAALLERLAPLQHDPLRARALAADATHARHAAARQANQTGVRLLLRVGQYEKQRGAPRQALETQEIALGTALRVLGEDDLGTLVCATSLAISLGEQGKLADARKLLEWTLAGYVRVLGEDDPITLSCMSDLAVALERQGDLAGARGLQERALAMRLERLGSDHPDTLVSMNNLAEILGAQGELAEARALQQQALEASRRLLGEDHPRTLISMHNLAATLAAEGQLDESRSLEEAALGKQRRLLGEDHPDTLATMNNLARTLVRQGDLAGARALQEQLLAACRRVLGESSPYTLAALSNLAETLLKMDEPAGARTIQEEALALLLRVQGEDSRATIAAMSRLAKTLDALGDQAAARGLQERALAGNDRLLGKEHLHTVISAWDLLQTLMALEDIDGARSLVARQLRWLVEHDPSTLSPDHRMLRSGLRHFFGLDPAP